MAESYRLSCVTPLPLSYGDHNNMFIDALLERAFR